MFISDYIYDYLFLYPYIIYYYYYNTLIYLSEYLFGTSCLKAIYGFNTWLFAFDFVVLDLGSTISRWGYI